MCQTKCGCTILLVGRGGRVVEGGGPGFETTSCRFQTSFVHSTLPVSFGIFTRCHHFTWNPFLVSFRSKCLTFINHQSSSSSSSIISLYRPNTYTKFGCDDPSLPLPPSPLPPALPPCLSLSISLPSSLPICGVTDRERRLVCE